MGNYNPHAPYIIGQEWVPIRQANYKPDNVTEQGYTFRVDHSATPVTGAFYVAAVPESRVDQVSDLISVYAAGNEELTGPIKVVNIPASAIWVTGGTAVTSAGVAALLNPSDDLSLGFTSPSDNNTFIGISFNVDAYSQQLMGKRILDVSFRYSWAVIDAEDAEDIDVNVGFAKDIANQGFYFLFDIDATVLGNHAEHNKIASFSISALNPYWDATRDLYTMYDIYPWRFQELRRFMATEPAASRMMLTFFNGMTSGNTAFFYFCDMQVTYCEETRILYGGKKTKSLSSSSGTSAYEAGPNLVRLLNTNFDSATTALTPGQYTVTLTHDELPLGVNGVGAADVSAIRELYNTGAQPGVIIGKTLVPDEQFTLDSTPVITEITLHTSSAVVTGVHPYGIQDDIPVYGTITAIQEIEDDPVGTSKSYPQVRFYARRFGRTNIPLTLVDVATGLSTVSISVADFDALPEIVDGWREVTLRFATAPSFATAAGDVDWRWQASSESAGNQWQVLGAGSYAFAAHSIGVASYYAPQGNTVDLTWQSPTISGTAEDTLSDAVLIFATDPPSVTGFAISAESQAVSGIAEGCLVPGNCVPTAIDYHELTWTPFGVCDQFDRTLVDDWGTTDTNQVYTLSGGTNPGNYDVADGAGTHTLTTTATARNSTASVSAPFSITSVRVDVAVSALATGDSIIAGPALGTDFDNMYQARLQFTTSGTVVLEIIKRLAGAQVSLGSVTVGGYEAGVPWTVTLLYRVGSRLEASAWPQGGEPPRVPQQVAIDNAASTITTFTAVILRSVLNAGNTNTNPVVSFSDLSSVTEQLRDGSIEIQRRDDLTDWQTIMLSTNPGCVQAFNDFEARVGQLSEYRIRTLNALDFAGAWVTGSGTVPTPGVDIGGVSGTDGNSVLIFTSNEDPSSNLAYVMQFEGQPVETFAFPEAGEVQLQRMYGKDFFTAFHPLERGGDQFTRTILVNAAAIPIPSLANVTQLRDLAWADLNYVCVRDELGNRWFANVRVPDDNVRMNRTIYLAQIQVSEVTGTPTPVDPEV